MVGNRKYQAIIFDLYGTLVNNFSVKEYRSMLTEMSEILGIDKSCFIDEWLKTFEMRALGKLKNPEENIKYIFKKVEKTISEELIKRAANIRYSFNKDSLLRPRRNYINTLNKLVEMGYILGLISDCSYETIKAWKNSQLNNIFINPVFSAEVGLKKPDIRIYQIACARLGVEPGQCIYVGDGGSYELTGAANAGMTPVKIQVPYEMNNNTYRIDEDKRECRIIKSIDELFELDLLKIEN